MSATLAPAAPAARLDAEPYLRRATLSDGLRVAVRPLLPTDREAVAAGFAGLSEQTRYRRFLAGKPSLSGRDLVTLVDRVDQHDHVAVALVWPRTSCPDVLLGAARFIRVPGRPDTADVAVTIADEVQGRGAGRLLIAVLAELAAERGITRFTGTLLPTNVASARMLASVGTVTSDRLDGGVREIAVLLSSAGHP
jgi:RimJ/RimL family protein N-acetyltransferase